jgi:hypothetical protein
MKNVTLFVPASDSVVSQLKTNLKNALSSVFSFEPKSNQKLEEVLFRTIGFPNGRQQWEGAENERDIHLIDLIRDEDDGRVLSHLTNHADPVVRALASGLSKDIKKNLIIMYSLADFNCINHSDVLTEEDKIECLRYIDSCYDANLGITNDTFAYTVIEHIERFKEFVSEEFGIFGFSANSIPHWVSTQGLEADLHCGEEEHEDEDEDEDENGITWFNHANTEKDFKNAIKGYWRTRDSEK